VGYPHRDRFSHRPWRHGPPFWRGHESNKRRFIIFRLVFFIGALLVLFLVALGLVLAFVLPSMGERLAPAAWPLVLVCAVPLVMFLLAGFMGGLFYRRVGAPLVEVMAAADAVAAGDLSVRVRESAPGEFGNLGRSFNRMAVELERAETQRRNLTADVAHELRTPLHIIQGNLEGILDGVYQADAEHIQATLDETRLLARLVNDLQTLSLAEAGQLPMQRVPLSAAGVLEDVATSFAGQAASAGVDLRLDLPTERSGLEVIGDPDRLDQIFTNLVANALQHTPPGSQITLSARAAPDSVHLVVGDNGEGIPAEDLPYVFDRFWRGDKARTRREGAGSGLGLAIVRQLVLNHGGTVRVDSVPGQGTVFRVDLPSAGG
jgi:two-component system OmpR family sensor kinase/two-component system sensor histidine kinase BaeS